MTQDTEYKLYVNIESYVKGIAQRGPESGTGDNCGLSIPRNEHVVEQFRYVD